MLIALTLIAAVDSVSGECTVFLPGNLSQVILINAFDVLDRSHDRAWLYEI